MTDAQTPRRLLFLCGATYVSGMEIAELELMRSLQDRGHTVHCVVSGWNDGDFIGRLEDAGIPHTVAFLGKVSRSLRPRHLWWTADALRHVPGARRVVRHALAAFKPDVVVACNPDAVLLLGSAVLRAHPLIFHAHNNPAVSASSRSSVQRLNRQVALFVVVSAFTRDRLLHLGVPPGKVRVVYNGVSEPSFADRACEGDPVVGIVGQVGPWKGHDDLFEALAVLTRREVSFRCHVVGRGDAAYVASLKATAERAGFAHRIAWSGFVKSLDTIYRPLDILVAPTRIDESFGLTVSEAGIRGLPVIGTRRGAIPEQIVDAETGFLIEAQQPAELAERLGELLSSPELRRRLGAAARLHIGQRFTRDRTAVGFEAAVEAAVLHHQPAVSTRAHTATA